MKVRAALVDFDYTITTKDTLDLLAKHFNKQNETAKLDRLFWEGKLPGLQGLISRINILGGLTRQDINETLNNEEFLRDGARELFDYFMNNNITSIIASGNILPVLENANLKLGADYLVCSKPKMVNDAVESISEEDYSGDGFKINDTVEILKDLGIPSNSVIAIGDSPADKSLFEFAEVSFAVDPKNGIEKYTTYTIGNSLKEIIQILEQIRSVN